MYSLISVLRSPPFFGSLVSLSIGAAEIVSPKIKVNNMTIECLKFFNLSLNCWIKICAQM